MASSATGMDEQSTEIILPKEWTKDDFANTDEPWDWLIEQKQKNPRRFKRILFKVKELADKVKYTTFLSSWKDYDKYNNNGKRTDYTQNVLTFSGQDTRLRCGEYLCDEFGGIYRQSEVYGRIDVCSHPIMPVKRVVSVDNGKAKIELAFCRGKDGWKTMIVPKACVASTQKIIELADQNIAVTSENARELVKYLSSVESMNYDDLPTQLSTSHLGWLPNGEFAPYAEDVVYDGNSEEYQRIFNNFVACGSEDTWMSVAKSVRSGKSLAARIALAASFAAPLVKFCGDLPFIIHLWGATGCGKTVALLLAASVWCKPDRGSGYIKTLGDTKNAQEIFAAFCQNTPVLFDELQLVAEYKTYDDMIYKLCQGTSKGRATRDGGLRRQNMWSNCFITTGETPILQSSSGGGAYNRCIEVKYGDTPLFGDQQHASDVAETVKENYGFAGRKFIEAVSRPGMIEAIKVNFEKFKNKLLEDETKEPKQAIAAATILIADMIVDKVLFRDGKSVTVEEIKSYLVNSSEIDVNQRCYQYLVGWVSENSQHFDDDAEIHGGRWGKFEGEYVSISKNKFDEALLSGGFRSRAFLEWCKQKNLSIYENYGPNSRNNRLTTRISLGHGMIQVAKIRLPADKKTEQEEYQDFVAVDAGADMPF